MSERGKIEKVFESFLWKSRLTVIIAVVFSLIGALIILIVASLDILYTVVNTINFFTNHNLNKEAFHSKLLSQTIGAIDLYLIAVVMIIFSFGLYELFVSDIDDAENTSVGNRILSIHTLDELKDKIGKVVVMVLIVGFFKRVLHMNFNAPLEMFYFSLCILALSLALYFLHKK